MTERAKRPSSEKDLPVCYQFGDARPVLCYFCQRDITKESKVRMGEYSPRFECVTCTDCAKQPYPLAELSRESAAYRITQAQLAAEQRDDERV